VRCRNLAFAGGNGVSDVWDVAQQPGRNGPTARVMRMRPKDEELVASHPYAKAGETWGIPEAVGELS